MSQTKGILAIFPSPKDVLALTVDHGASKEGRRLAVEDGCRVLFHTAIVIYELDHALVRE